MLSSLCLVCLIGCDINKADSDGTTVLTKSIEKGFSEIVDMLLSLPHCDPNRGAKVVPLHAAVRKTDEGLIRRLVERGADINKVSTVTTSGDSMLPPDCRGGISYERTTPVNYFTTIIAIAGAIESDTNR